MYGRGASNGHRHLVIERNVTNGNGPNVATSGTSSGRSGPNDRNTGGDGRSIDQAREVLLVAASRRASESAVVRQYAAEDLGLTAAEWVGRSVPGAKLWF